MWAWILKGILTELNPLHVGEDCRRYFQLIPGHTTKIIIRIRSCESQRRSQEGMGLGSFLGPPADGGGYSIRQQAILSRCSAKRELPNRVLLPGNPFRRILPL
jgi:hypothetical protein